MFECVVSRSDWSTVWVATALEGIDSSSGMIFTWPVITQ